LPQAGPHLPFRVFGQQIAVQVGRAAGHHVPSNDVFADGVFKEIFGSNNFDRTGLNVSVRNNTFNATAVVNVAMSINDGHNGLFADVAIY